MSSFIISKLDKGTLVFLIAEMHGLGTLKIFWIHLQGMYRKR